MRYTLYFLMLISSSTFAQANHTDSQSNLDNLTGNGNLFKAFDTGEKDIDGYATLFKEYVPGRIFLTDGSVVDRTEVNYDVLSDQVLVKSNGAEMAVVNKAVKKFTLVQQSDSLHFVRVHTGSGDKFLHLLVDGHARLYRVVKKFVKEPEKGPYSGNKNRQLLESVSYFWQLDNSMPTEIKTKKDLLDELDKGLRYDFHTFVKKEKINVKKEEELVKLFAFINEDKHGS